METQSLDQSHSAEPNADRDHVTLAASQERRSLLSEFVSGLEWLALKVSPVYYGLGVAHGDGEPVILVPGFFGTDLAMTEMHLWLGRMGYRSYPSGIGVNADCPDVLLERLEETMARAYEETGRRVHLVGFSLGGLLARAAAVRRPDLVAQLITGGTPFHRLSAHRLMKRLIKRVFRRGRQRRPGACMPKFFAALRQCVPDSVAHAAICSPTDPVVDYRDCAGVPGATNIEARSSHVGMIANPGVYHAVAGLLAEPQPARTRAAGSTSGAALPQTV